MNKDGLTSTKYSRQQDVVRESIMNRFDHPTAEQVYKTARRNCPKISLATVYRNLDRLVNEGVVNKFTVQDEPDHYDPAQEEHYHVHCKCCKRIYDIETKIYCQLSDIIREQTEIEMESIQLLAEGICKKCIYKTGKETI